MDAWLLAAVVSEVQAGWAGARVQRVGQAPGRLIHLQLYQPVRPPEPTGDLASRDAERTRHLVYLVLSAEADADRVHLSPSRPPNAPVPPAFCMALRRHLEGSRLLACRQDGLERVLDLRFQGRDELGNPRLLHLYAELTGRQPNLVLTGPDDRILEAIRHTDPEAEAGRPLLPGLPYAPPPRSPGRIDPVLWLRDQGAAALGEALAGAWSGRPPQEDAAARLQATVFGLSPTLAGALAAWAAGAPDGPPAPVGLPGDAGPLAGVVAALGASVLGGTFRPCVATDRRGRPLACAWPLPGRPGLPAAGPSDACRQAYAALDDLQRLEGLRQRVGAALRGERQRVARRLAKQGEELAAAGDADALREAGELLLCYGQQVPRGAGSVELPAFDDPARAVHIDLDPRLSPVANAQRLLRRYQKERRAQEAVTARLEVGRAELAYLAECDLALAQADGADELQALEAELLGQGLLRPGRRVRVARRGGGADGGRDPGGNRPAPPLTFAAADGWTILVGRNAAGNDHLTMRQAHPQDVWLHAKQMPGSHVLLRAPAGAGRAAAPPEAALMAAARCAAYYSAGRGASRVPVDHTLRRHVWKPGGAKPGFVLYEGERTLLVDPVDLPPRLADPERQPPSGRP